tara:strand:- start:3 stop:710 length:708 start_codon:yes stop_codon:yes gene_type:complete
MKDSSLKVVSKLPDQKRQIEFYNEIFSSKQNHWAKDLNRTFDNLFADTIIGNYDSKNHKRFLEIGCGDGRFFDVAFEKIKELGLELNAIDYCPNAVELAKKENWPVKFICDDYLRWSDKQEKFDIIYSSGVFEHFEDIELALRQTKNILSSNGFFLLSVPNCLGYDINKDDQAEGFRELNGGSRQVEWHLKLETWKRIIEEAGFSGVFYKGFDERIGFTWILKNNQKEESTGVFS